MHASPVMTACTPKQERITHAAKTLLYVLADLIPDSTVDVDSSASRTRGKQPDPLPPAPTR